MIIDRAVGGAVGTRVPFVHEWFRRIARERPRDIAIDAGGDAIDYATLAERVAAMAASLRGAGAAPGQPIAIAAVDRVDIVVAAIGVLEAGCAFVPLPLEFPDARLELMLSESAPRWAIADTTGAERLPTLAARSSIDLRLLPIDPIDAGAPPSIVEPDPDALAYIVFTSGSTGRPKGIAGRLKSIDHFVRWEIETLNLEPGVRVSQLSSPAFDVFLRDVFAPLCAGGTICIPPSPSLLLDGRAFADWIESQDINLIHCVPSVFRLLFDALDRPDRFSALRHVLLAGEPLLPADIARWTGALGDRVQIVNLYGPSETTMTKFYYVIRPEDAQRASVPIGRPMPGAAALLMDEQGGVCAPGAVGEIYIRTAFRSLGYYRRPELTREVFLPNPLSADPDDLVYKTGDLGRLRSDGLFEFVGRRDQQVKVRGVRVEPAEIESALRTSPLVRDAAVVDREDGTGSRYLAAYVVMADDGSMADAQRHLAAHVPDYMMPSRWTKVDALPRTPNGKLDRRALPDPDAAPAPAVRATAPRTPLNEIVAGVWSEVLKRPHIGPDESFFEIGGHSLLATRVISRLRSACKVDLPLRALFHAPTIAGLSKVIRELQLSKAGLVAPPIGRADRSHALPLSFAQQRLWFLEQLDPGTPTYHISMACRLAGGLDLGALRGALREIVRRHEVLRTTFGTRDGTPVQQVHQDVALDVPLVDLSALAAPVRDGAARHIAAATVRRPFDLSKAPLLRVVVQRIGPADHVLAVVMHHAAGDGWSIEILAREFAALYQAFRRGQRSPLPPLAVQYADYAAWERDWLTDERIGRLLNYWRAQLRGLAPLELVTDAPRPPAASYRAAQLRFALDVDLSVRLRALAQREGVTPFMLLLAAFQLVLSRWSGQHDIVVGTDVANREQLETENLIGFFVNQLVLRTDVSGNPTFRELLARVRDVTLAGYAHQQLPFEKLVEALAPERDIRRHPLFQVVFAMRNDGADGLRVEGVEIHDVPLDIESVNFDLTLVMGDSDAGIGGVLLYARDLFGERTAARLTQHLTRVLEAAAEDADVRVADVQLAGAAERDAIAAWSTADAPADLESPCRAVERLAAASPSAVAAEIGDTRLTYGNLNRRANQLARYLQAHAVTAESVVAVSLPRGLDLLVSLLAILKAGGAYLPIDPRYPREHATRLARDANATAWITNDAAIAEDLPAVKRIALDRPADIQRLPATAPPRVDDPRRLAYVIYTSGSTGVPKGVMIEGRGLWNHLRAKVDDLQLTAADVVAQTASCAFDISIWQLLAPLMVGGVVRIVPDQTVRDSAALVDDVDRAGVTILEVVPSLLEAMLDELAHRTTDRPALSRLRYLLSTGEALPSTIGRRWQEAYPHAALVNAYGPTECSDDVTHYRADESAGGVVPLGRPLRGLSAYVLDDAGAIAATGVTGQLYVGGIGVGRGYLRAPSRTAESFVPDRFGDAGARLFKTGDLARWNADGDLEYLGRADEQVKIRGFRIELGDVHAAVSAHPGVRQSVVVARSAPAGDRRLVAYVVPRRWSIFPAAGGFCLPDGSALAEQNRNETRYLYQRIFERRIYCAHGIELAEDACIFDVGANVGLFTSLASELAPKGRIYAFEPIGPIVEHLRANVRGCQADVRVFDYGLAEAEQSATFAYYPGYSIMSGLAKYASASSDVGILKQYLRNESDEGDAQAAEALADADRLLAGRLQSEPFQSRLRSLSDVLREQAVDRIDLLKIDVQRAGLDVLRGIARDDWPRIDQIVMEVHDNVDAGGHVSAIRALLVSHGFDVTVEQETLLRGTDLHNVYARRQSTRRDARPAARPIDPPVIVSELRDSLARRLPDYMVPSSFVLMRELPLTTSGKVDRSALPEPAATPQRERRAPRTALEQVVLGVWMDVLQIDRLGIDDDFFEVGGHSLLATRVLSRIRQLLRVDVSVRAMFEAPTVEQLARTILAHDTKLGQAERIARAVVRAKQLSADERQTLLAQETV